MRLRVRGSVLIPMLLATGTLLLAQIPLGWHHRGRRVAGIVLANGMIAPPIFAWHYLTGRRQAAGGRRARRA